MSENENNKEFLNWAKSGLEFEFRVENEFKKNDWIVHYEYDYEVLREIPEMGQIKEKFVERSIDLSPVKIYSYQPKEIHYSIQHQALVEVKYSRGKFCFLNGSKILKDNTNNIGIWRDDSTKIKNFMGISRELIPDTPLLYKGTVISNGDEDFLQRAVNRG